MIPRGTKPRPRGDAHPPGGMSVPGGAKANSPGGHDSRGDASAKARPRGDFPEGKTIFDLSTETLYLP